MKGFMYPRLAFNSIKNNGKYYIPYILSGILLSAMTYILNYLNCCEFVSTMKGGLSLMTTFGFGTIIMQIFSFIFLFYANSFLIKRRDKELGLYAILGMNKINILKVIFFETLYVMIAVLVFGMLGGMMLSKLMELILAKLCHVQAGSSFGFYLPVVENTCFYFACIYFVLFLYSVIRVRFSTGLHLMQGESYGEKAPKANWLIALIGAVILGVAYYMAVTITTPLLALQEFFIAVVMVIIATYILFTAGSVALCKLLEKNKKYYYHPNHFVSVGMMRFRMKRNGAGLASICILITMVLVLGSFTVCTYCGIQDSIAESFPHDLYMQYASRDISMDEVKPMFEDFIQENIPSDEVEKGGIIAVKQMDIFGTISEKGYEETKAPSFDRFFVVSLDTYNQMTGRNETLQDGQCLVVSKSDAYKYSTFTFAGNAPFEVKEMVHETLIPDANNISTNNLSLVVKNVEDLTYPANCENALFYMADLKEGASVDIDTLADNFGSLNSVFNMSTYGSYSYSFASRQEAMNSYYTLFGGIIVLAGLLSVVFLSSAVLIIYYKQIVEGLEDVKRFEVLRKVGMDDTQIKKTINSQVIFVFFMPLILAGIHLLFAYPVISRLLVLFAIKNMSLMAVTSVVTFVIIGIFYGIVYKLTSRTYFHIVHS